MAYPSTAYHRRHRKPKNPASYGRRRATGQVGHRKPRATGSLGYQGGGTAGAAGTPPSTPSAPTAAPASAPAPPRPKEQMPWDAAYETDVGTANRNYADATARYGQEEAQLRSDYGFDPEFANNPMTRANLLQKSHDTARRSAVNQMAAQGQGYSGATTNQLGYADFNYNQSRDTEMKRYQGGLNKIEQGRLGASRTKDELLAQAKAAALERALASQEDPSEFTDQAGDQISNDEFNDPFFDDGSGGGSAAAKKRRAQRGRRGATSKKPPAKKPAAKKPAAPKPSSPASYGPAANPNLSKAHDILNNPRSSPAARAWARSVIR